jgi:hypothetical protein
VFPIVPGGKKIPGCPRRWIQTKNTTHILPHTGMRDFVPGMTETKKVRKNQKRRNILYHTGMCETSSYGDLTSNTCVFLSFRRRREGFPRLGRSPSLVIGNWKDPTRLFKNENTALRLWPMSPKPRSSCYSSISPLMRCNVPIIRPCELLGYFADVPSSFCSANTH